MAGRARTRALTDELEKRAREASDDDLSPMSTLDYVCEWLEAGKTIKELAAELSETLGDDVTFARVMAVLRSQHGAAQCEERTDRARAHASHLWAEESIAIVDAPAETTVEVSRAASRAKSRQWLAGVHNRAKYGQDKGVSVNVTVGSLHLDALRAFPAKVAEIVTVSPQQALPSPAVTEGENS